MDTVTSDWTDVFVNDQTTSEILGIRNLNDICDESQVVGGGLRVLNTSWTPGGVRLPSHGGRGFVLAGVVRQFNSISALPEGAGSLLIHVGYLFQSMRALNDGSLRVVLVQGGVFHPCDENGHGDV